MAYTTFGTAASTSLRDRLVGRIDALKADFAKYRVYRRTLGELGALTDRDLADLGLHRSAIKSVAIEAAYGK